MASSVITIFIDKSTKTRRRKSIQMKTKNKSEWRALLWIHVNTRNHTSTFFIFANFVFWTLYVHSLCCFHILCASQQVTPHTHLLKSSPLTTDQVTSLRIASPAIQVTAVVWAAYPGNCRKNLWPSLHLYPRSSWAFSRPFLGLWPPFVMDMPINSRG